MEQYANFASRQMSMVTIMNKDICLINELTFFKRLNTVLYHSIKSFCVVINRFWKYDNVIEHIKRNFCSILSFLTILVLVFLWYDSNKCIFVFILNHILFYNFTSAVRGSYLHPTFNHINQPYNHLSNQISFMFWIKS